MKERKKTTVCMLCIFADVALSSFVLSSLSIFPKQSKFLILIGHVFHFTALHYIVNVYVSSSTCYHVRNILTVMLSIQIILGIAIY